MRIDKLEIRGFGRFQNQTFTPGSGMNVIYGSNEAGKSTLQSFIRAMLFGVRSGKRGRDVRQYQPWHGKSFGGILEYTLEDGRRYTAGRNFEKNTVFIQDEYLNNITGSFPGGREQDAGFAEQHLGIPESGFERTAFIGQLQTPVDAEGRKILAERLMNLRDSADEDISLQKALKALRDAQLSEVGSERTTTRPLNLVETRLAEAVREELELNRRREIRLELSLELSRLQQENRHLNERLEEAILQKEAMLAHTKAAQLGDLVQQLRRYEAELAQVCRERQKHEAAALELRVELDGLDGYKTFTHQDVHELSVDYTHYLLFEKELAELQIKKAENAQKQAETHSILTRYALFDREKELIDQNLRQLLETSDDTEKGRTERAALRRIWSFALAATATGVILTDIFLFGTQLPASVNAAVLTLGAVLLSLSLVFFLLETKWGRNILKKGDRGANENRERLLQWLQAVNAADLKEFIQLKALYESSLQHAGEFREEQVLLERRESWNEAQLASFRIKILSRLEGGNPREASGMLTPERIEAWKEDVEAYHNLLPTLKEAQGAAETCALKQEGILREAALLNRQESASRQTWEGSLQSRISNTHPSEAFSEHALREFLKQTELELEMLQTGTLQVHGPIRQHAPDIEALQQAIASNLLEMNTLQARLEGIPDDEALQQVHERIETLRLERDSLLFLSKAMDTAIHTLTEAGLAIQRDYVPALNREMSDILSMITDKKYVDLKADDSLTLKLQPPEGVQEVFPDQLSSGTMDQVYFALRLAAVRLVEKKSERLPLFLDEPFAQYDEERTKKALLLLAQESKNRQILLFTCKKREVEMVTELFQDEPPRIHYLNDTSGVFPEQ